MANTATALQTLQASFPYGQKGGFSRVIQYRLTFDTLATPLTVHGTPAGKNTAIVGMQYAETTAHSLSWYSNVNLIVTLEMPANTVVNQGLGTCAGSYIITRTGEPLVAQVDTALINTMLVYVAELDGGVYYINI